MKPFGALALALALAWTGLSGQGAGALKIPKGPLKLGINTKHLPRVYQVSLTKGKDQGPGTPDAPWRTIQYALDHALPTPGATPIIFVDRGLYVERLTIKAAVALFGSSDPAHPTILRMTGNPTVTVPPELTPEALSLSFETLALVTIRGSGRVTLKDLTLDGLSHYAGVSVVGAPTQLESVKIQGPRSVGAHFRDVQVGEVLVKNCLMTNIYDGNDFSADVAIDVWNSKVRIEDTVIEPSFDHAINLQKGTAAQVRRTTVHGSLKAWYADGIRVCDSSALIRACKLVRSAGAPQKTPEQNYDLPCAAVQLTMSSEAPPGTATPNITVEDCEMSGFDVGVGAGAGFSRGGRVKVQGNKISAREAAVQLIWVQGALKGPWNEAAYGAKPQFDFGGGPLGGLGGNSFSLDPLAGAPMVLFDLQHPCDAWALKNTWPLSGPALESAILDKKVDPDRGTVYH